MNPEKSKVCGFPHGKGAHRFHGKGSYHQTHLFSFGGNPVAYRSQRRVRNPEKKLVMIYGNVLRVEAQKTQPHRCDSKCMEFRHKYYHRYRGHMKMYGVPASGYYLLRTGDVIITSRKAS